MIVATGQKERCVEAEVHHSITVRAGDAFDEPVHPEPPEDVGHSALGDLVRRKAEQLGDMLSQVAVRESLGQKAKQHQS